MQAFTGDNKHIYEALAFKAVPSFTLGAVSLLVATILPERYLLLEVEDVLRFTLR